MAVTVVVRSSGEGRELSLTIDAPRMVIGRGEGCEVRLPDPSVSHRHASLRQRGGEHVLVDEGSSNGTFLGNVRLPPQTPRAVRSGELVRVGRVWLEIRFEPVVVKGGTAVAAKEVALELVARGLAAQGEEPGPRVRILDGPDRDKTLIVAEAGRRYVFGRAKEADLALDDMAAGRRHLEVSRKGDGLLVRDLGSGSASFVDGAPLGPLETVWRAGQELTLGMNRFGFDYAAAEALAELERSPDERMRPGDAPPLPAAGSGDDATPEVPAADGATPTPAPLATSSEARAAHDERSGRNEGTWGLVDAVVVLLALGVLAVSALGAWWLFH